MYIPVEFDVSSLRGEKRCVINANMVVRIEEAGHETLLYCANSPHPLVLPISYDKVKEKLQQSLISYQ